MQLRHVVFGMVALAGTSAAAVPAVQQTHPPGRTATGLATIAPPTPDADELAEQMRVLAKNPKDVDALIRAGELTLMLRDPTAAAVLFSRAEKIEPNNPRMKAGMAATLVRMERPGQALRLFAEAEKGGYDVAKFAADRGLAYDLVGAQERAQRDYRLALEHDRQDETLRRYALSLGISGRKDEAMALLDPLLRHRDRAAWRDRAFIFAMNGEPDKAEEIAAAMMPGPVSEGLEPFFQRLDDLSPVDRAFAVHFGELNPSPARLADARLVPPLPALTPDATRVAAAEPKADARKPGRTARRKRGETGLQPGRTQIASADAAPPAAAVRSAPSPAATVMPTTPARTPATTRPSNVATAAPTTIAPKPSTVGSEDTILERIIAGISVPASELAEAPATEEAAPTASAGTSDVARAQAALEAANAKAEAERRAAIEKAAERKAEREAKAEADRKAAAKKAAEEKAAAKKKAEEEKKAKAEPARFWVQVAGGANEKTLGRAYARIVDKAPELMKGKQGWWTPLNATNRVLTGPFKSAGEAQEFVNKLAGAGVSAFPFVSNDGQKVAKLPRK